MGEIIRTPGVHTQEQASDNTALTAEDLANGNLNVGVGVAPTQPAEFVVIPIQQFNQPSTPPPPGIPVKPPTAVKNRNRQ